MKKKYRDFLFIVAEVKNVWHVLWSIIMNNSPSFIELKNGILIHSTTNSPVIQILREIFVLHVYDPPILPIEREDIVVNIGANIGIFSIYAKLITQNRVIAFEPYPAAFKVLQKNSAANYLEIEALNYAVSNKEKTQKLFIAQSDGGHSFYDQGRMINYIDVPSVTLERIFELCKIEKIDFLKLDCEGAEFDIILSAGSILNRIKKISMEFHDNVSNYTHHDIQAYLSKLGFNIRVIKSEKSPFGYLYAKKEKV